MSRSTAPEKVAAHSAVHHRARHKEIGTVVGRPPDQRLAPISEANGLRMPVGERVEWQRAADYDGVKLQTWIRARLNEAAAASRGRRTR